MTERLNDTNELVTGDEAIAPMVAEYYLSSSDFNGLPVRNLFASDSEREAIRAALGRLVHAGSVTLEFGLAHPNPYIKALRPPPEATQLAALEASDLQHVCAYPTEQVLATIVGANESQDRPFTRRLMLGEPQLEFHAFDPSVLEYYRNDPRYYYETDDISGHISVTDPVSGQSPMLARDQVVLESFGFAFDDSLERAVVVFTRYLSDLSPEHQQLWEAIQEGL